MANYENKDYAFRLEWLSEWSYCIDNRTFDSGFEAVRYLQTQNFTEREALNFVQLLCKEAIQGAKKEQNNENKNEIRNRTGAVRN